MKLHGGGRLALQWVLVVTAARAFTLGPRNVRGENQFVGNTAGLLKKSVAERPERESDFRPGLLCSSRLVAADLPQHASMVPRCPSLQVDVAGVLVCCAAVRAPVRTAVAQFQKNAAGVHPPHSLMSHLKNMTHHHLFYPMITAPFRHLHRLTRVGHRGTG